MPFAHPTDFPLSVDEQAWASPTALANLHRAQVRWQKSLARLHGQFNTASVCASLVCSSYSDTPYTVSRVSNISVPEMPVAEDISIPPQVESSPVEWIIDVSQLHICDLFVFRMAVQHF
ncbi:unnamed protein product [Protopolystoma xenopodis]|uniref:Uncharacterized protein n=1 Tax=Protopolystoma xenopodis TaxID=117903 RepID=A0A448W9U4_9PLAT|nr:unnamed protein product [Protopolystoma xenopodis]